MEDTGISPKRVFTVGGSDYSAYVIKWPKIKRTTQDLRSVNLQIPLANDDGHLNFFYSQTYSIPASCTLRIGFEHPTSGDELVTVYAGTLEKVTYSDNKCTLKVRDKFHDLSLRKVGDSDNPVTVNSSIPSEIAWTLCTCYGQLSNVRSTSNPDIDYGEFLAWAGVFSADSIHMSARYEGRMVSDAVSRLARMTDSAIYVEGNGKITFERFESPNSLDATLVYQDTTKFNIDVDTLRLINKQHVSLLYSETSDYWQGNVYSVDSVSVNSFGLHEDLLQDDSIWYVSSTDATVMASRKTKLLSQPPRRFDAQTGLRLINQQLGETLRLVNSFYAVDSSQGWRMAEYQIDMDNGLCEYIMDEAGVMNAFFLDVSDLDGDDLLV
jgi:hypothetical protein